MTHTSAFMSATAEPATLLDIDDLPLPYAEIDARGMVARANRAALALHHPGLGNLIGKSGWDLMTVSDKDSSSAAFLSQMASSDEPPVITRSLFSRSGSFRTYEMHRSLMRDAAGNPSGMRVIVVDVTDSKNALEEARRTAHWLRSALQSVADAVILTDTLGIVRSINPAAEELSGWRACDLIGLAIETVLPDQTLSCEADPVLNLRALLEHPCSGLAAILTRDGREVRVAINASPILDNKSGSVSGVTVLLRRTESPS